jgi:parallel beta-helix repeat protein
MWCALLVLLVLLSPWSAWGANLFVGGTGASDANPGTDVAPFATIQRCATLAVSGDSCRIRAGTYRETVTPAANGVIYEPDGAVVVTVSGADLVTGWTVHSGSIYKSTSLSLPLGLNNQVFVDGVMMNLARFPNTSLDVSHPTFATTDESLAPTSESQVEDNDFGPYIFTDSALTQASGFWVGAEITQLAGNHWSQAGVVTAYTTGRIEYDHLHQTQQRYDDNLGGQYPYYLSNKLGALDTGGEWYYDSGITTLYLWTPDSSNPSGHTVEAKRRQWAFELSGRSTITVRNLNIFAASINMNSASTGNVLDGINVKYVWHQLRNFPAPGINQFDSKWGGWMTGIIMHGSNNVLKNCTIAFSSHNGVYLHGNNNTVDNCTIHDVTYLKTEGGGVSWMGQDAGGSSPGCSGLTVSNNTIYNTGNEGINAYYCTSFLITHNDISHWGIQTLDNGCFYTSKGGTSGTLSYNHCHDTEATGYRFGIYMDANPQNYTVHHNVVWNVAYGINVGEPSLNVNIYNNTIWFVQDGFSLITLTPGSSNVKVYNNLAKNGIDSGTDPQNNLETSSPGFVDVNAFNFQLQESSPAKNIGRQISGITTNCVGDCDVGAYEFGATPWTVGATVTGSPTCPVNCTCTVPGICDTPPVGGLNPVAWWEMEAGTGSSVVDSSGNNRTGTIQGPIWTGGRIGSFGLQFDGINDVVSLPDAVLASFSTDHTVCQWAQVSDISAIGTAGFKQTLVNLAQDTSNGVRIVEAEAGPVGGWAVSVTAGGTMTSRQTTTPAFTNNTWTHLCHTWSAGTLTLYTNAVAQATTDPGGYALGASSFLGGQTPTTGNLGGKLDQVKVWNRALSASEIQSEMLGVTGTPARVSHRSVFK